MATESQTDYNYWGQLYTANRTRVGQRLTISSRIVSKLAFRIGKWGSPTGDVTFTIRKVSDSSIIASKVWGDASALAVGVATKEVTFDSAVLINEEVRILCEYVGGNGTNYVSIVSQLTDVKADEYRTYYHEGWFDVTDTDAYYIYTYTTTVAPTVTTDPATGIEAAAATLNGTLGDDGGEACDCGFEWGETPGYGNTTPTQSRTTGQTFAQTISGLDPKKTYHFRAFATNASGTSYGADRTFTTLAVAPTVATNPAIDIDNDSATLKGELTYDGGEACNCGFEYGETDSYGTTTPTQSKVTGEAFSQPITGLGANKTYHFRAIATNSAGTSHGADRTFATLVSAPAVTTEPATGLGAVLATINGTLDDDIGEACECGFEWGLDTDYGTITPTETETAVDTFSQVIGGLIPNTVYHFRAFATNSFGTGYGADRTFTTALVISRAFALAREEL